MTLENIYYIGQTVAVAAILVSLIALIIQMRDANRLTRKTALRNQIDGLERLPRALFETPGLADICFRGCKEIATLTDAERIIFFSFSLSSLRVWEGLYAQYVEGEIDQELWDIHRKQIRDAILNIGSHEAWRFQKRLFSKQFQDFIDEVFAEVESFTKARSGTGGVQAVHSAGPLIDSNGDAP